MEILGEQRKTLLLLCLVTISGVIAEGNRKVKHDGVKQRQRQISKTIQTEDGDIFDCIDIKSQPAFDHPFLRNHTILMEPSSYPVELHGSSMLRDTTSESSIRSVPCPPGTIPIWRSEQEHPTVNLKEVIRKIYKGNMTQSNQQHINVLAGLSRGEDIYGTRVSVSVYDPEVYGTADKSGGLTTIIDGYSHDRQHANAVGAGWFVWQSAGGDKAARFHVFYDNGQKECFDFQCPGFVQTNRDIPLGGRLRPVSKYDGPQADMTSLIFQDKDSNWWVTLGRENTVVGYWPSLLFRFLKVKGTVAYWGGLVDGPTIKIKPPPMGSGHLASEGYGKAAYVKNIQVVKEDRKLVIPSFRELDEAADYPKCYTVANKVVEDGGLYANWGGPGDCKL